MSSPPEGGYREPAVIIEYPQNTKESWQTEIFSLMRSEIEGKNFATTADIAKILQKHKDSLAVYNKKFCKQNKQEDPLRSDLETFSCTLLETFSCTLNNESFKVIAMIDNSNENLILWGNPLDKLVEIFRELT